MIKNAELSQKLQKFTPYLLIIGTVLLGGYLLIRKGVITIPSSANKDNIVDIGKTSIVSLLFSGKEYKLSYSALNPDLLVDIAKFDQGEQWQGAGSIEEDVAFGEPVMSLVDRDRQKSSAFLLKNLNLAEIDNVKFIVNYKSKLEDVEALNIYFGNRDNTSFFRFPITNLIIGMNYLTIPKHRFFLVDETLSDAKPAATQSATNTGTVSWDKIERVQLELISRPGTKINADIGWIRGEKDDTFSTDWNWDGKEHFLNLYHTADGKLALKVLFVGRALGTLRKIGSVKDFTYGAKMISYKEGFTGLFFRGDYKSGLGYYLAIGGIRTSDWSITKYYPEEKQTKTATLLKGQIANFEFDKTQPFWLKVTAKGSNIIAYFSLDGENFTKLGEVVDNQFDSGGVGIASAGGAAIFDDFYLSLK